MNRRQANAAAAVYGDPFAGLHLHLIDNPVIRGHKPAPHTRRIDKRNRLRQRHQVQISQGYVGQPTVATAVHEPGGADIWTDILMSGEAAFTGTATKIKGTDDTVAFFEFRH